MKKLLLFISMFVVLNALNLPKLQKQCESGNGVSCNDLGVLYAKGQGVKQDYFQAKKYYEKACDLKVQKGCEYYAILNKQEY